MEELNDEELYRLANIFAQHIESIIDERDDYVFLKHPADTGYVVAVAKHGKDDRREFNIRIEDTLKLADKIIDEYNMELLRDMSKCENIKFTYTREDYDAWNLAENLLP